MYIKKDKDIKVLVLVFFLLAFLLFLFISPDYTGMVTIDTFSITTIEVDNTLESTDTVSLSFVAADSVPCDSLLFVNISLADEEKYFDDTKTLNDFIVADGGICNTNFAPGIDVTIDNEIIFFPGLDTMLFTEIGTHNFLFNLTDSSEVQIDYQTDTFEVSAALPPPPTSNEPIIEDVTFIPENGTDFRVDDKVNCSATVTDDSADEDISVSYIFWDGNDFSSPLKTGSVSCGGSSWSSGESCNVSVSVTNSYIGYWTCTIKVEDESNVAYENSSSTIEMLNSPPILDGVIDNITWVKNTNYTALDLYDHFDDPDDSADEELTFIVDGNESIEVEIDEDGDVKLIPEEDWTGNETVIFTAEDPEGAEVDSNDVVLEVVESLGCVSDWSCSVWTDCLNNTKTRICTDLNNCTVPNPPTNVTQACAPVQATCSSGDFCKTGCSGGDPDCSCDVQNGYLCGSSQSCETSVLASSDSGVCCSEACTSTVDTDLAGEGIFGFGTTTNKILMGVGAVAGVVFVATLVIIIITFIRRKNAKVIGEKKPTTLTTPTGAVSTAKPTETKPGKESVTKPLVSEPVKIRPVNYEKMRKYVEKSLKNKVPLRIIKSELEKAGWTKKDIDNELSIARLRNYVQIKINQGVPKKDIEASLKMKGWKKEQIKEVIKDAKLRPLF